MLYLFRVMSNKPEKELTGSQVYTIAGGHLFHDLFPAFLAPLLPTIIQNLSINLTMAGFLTSINRLPSILNPVFGYLSDKTGARYFVILAPAFTATLMSLLGIASSPASLALILFLSGISTTMFHASSPGLVAKALSERKGFGMSVYMAGGGIGRSLGPLLVIWAVSVWGLSGIYRLMFLGWGASLVLFIQFRNYSFQPKQQYSLRQELPYFRSFFIPLAFVLVLRSTLNACLQTYLPVYMVSSGSPIWLAGAALSILEISGVIGALVLGPFSDQYGRQKVLTISMLISSALVPIFLAANDWMTFPVLILLGFFSLSSGTIFLALVQDNFQHHRATGNSVYILISFLSNAVMLVMIGFVGDQFGLRTAYLIGAIAALLSAPALRLLPAGADK